MPESNTPNRASMEVGVLRLAEPQTRPRHLQAPRHPWLRPRAEVDAYILQHGLQIQMEAGLQHVVNEMSPTPLLVLSTFFAQKHEELTKEAYDEAGGDKADIALVAREGAQVRYALDGVVKTAALACAADGLHLAIGARTFLVREPSPWGPDAGADPSTVTAPVSGAVVKVNARPGQAVKAGDVLAVMEAMKMEMRLTAQADGTVSAVHAIEGSQATSGSVLIELDLQSQD